MVWLGEGRCCRSGRQPSEHGLEGLRLMAVPSEAQVLASAVAAVDRRDVHQVQDDRAQADPLRSLRAVLRLDLTSRLADAPEDVEGERREGEDERVRPVVPARKPLDVHVGLELAVELFARLDADGYFGRDEAPEKIDPADTKNLGDPFGFVPTEPNQREAGSI